MSTGHGHKSANMRHPAELKKIMADPDMAQLQRRWEHVDFDHDINDVAGYNVAGTVRYVDKDAVRALLDPDYADEIGVEIDTGLSGEDVIDCILEHEAVEKEILDGDNPIDAYLPAHEFATVAEHELVREKKGKPLKYERGLKKLIDWCARKVPKLAPADYACAPLLDDPDKNDTRVLKALRKLGVVDASKLSKGKVDYGKSTGPDQCARCEHWQGDRGLELSPCALVDGLVRTDRWCKRFEAEEDTDGEGQQTPGLQGGGGEDREELGDPEPGRGAGGVDPSSEPGGEEARRRPRADRHARAHACRVRACNLDLLPCC